MLNWIKNIWQHPWTSLLGLALGGLQIASAASANGLQLGHCGGSDCLKAVVGVGTILLGAIAKDPHAITIPSKP